jgi:hypothetical protein
MTRARFSSVFGAVGAIALISAAAPYSQGPPPSHTGGFGDPTCQACHVGGALNDPAGSLTISGLPQAYTPGRDYELVIRLIRPTLSRGGFQLAARFADGEMAGSQAGALLAVGRRQHVVTGPMDVHYAQHTSDGTFATDGTLAWHVTWRAPTHGHWSVVLNAAAIASNDDDSELGDATYTGAWRLRTE